MSPAEQVKADRKARWELYEWEQRYTQSPLHVILPAEPGTYILWEDWPNVPIRERIIAWDINTEEDGWRWPITVDGVVSSVERVVLHPDGSVVELGVEEESWSSLEDFICGKWGDDSLQTFRQPGTRPCLPGWPDSAGIQI